MTEPIKVRVTSERKQRFEALVEASEHDSQAEYIRDMIDSEYEDVFDENVDPSDADTSEDWSYSPTDDRGPLSSDELARLHRRYDAPALHPDHAPTTVPRDQYRKRQLLAAVLRYEVAEAEDGLEEDEAEYICQKTLKVGMDSTISAHLDGARQIIEREGAEPDNHTVPLSREDEIEGTEGMTVGDLIGTEFPDDVTADVVSVRAETAREVLEKHEVESGLRAELEAALEEMEAERRRLRNDEEAEQEVAEEEADAGEENSEDEQGSEIREKLDEMAEAVPDDGEED